MRKSIHVWSIILALSLIITSFGSTVAFAAETGQSAISFTDGFDAVETVELKSIHYFELEVSDPALTLAASSSDENVLSVNLQKDNENPGYYEFSLTAWATGDATVTFTASDDTTVSRKITVEDTGADRGYTISTDTTKDFSLPKGSSRVIKIHYESDNLDHYSLPVLVTDDQESSLETKLLDIDYDNNDYYYLVYALGSEGQTGKLYMGSSDYIPDLLCTVTIGSNKNLRLDTTSTYVCNVFDSYRFIAYTNSSTAPEVNTYNDLVSVELLGKVAGGYEYRMDAAGDEGDSLVEVTSNGETASFPVLINYDNPPAVKSDTSKNITLAQGSSYTYKFTIMGGGEPQFVADTAGVLSVQLIKKDGLNYYCQVTAVGEPKSSTSLSVTFPDSGNEDFDVKVGSVTVTEPTGVIMKSDTNSDFSIKQGSSYTFKITGATSFNPGSAGVFQTQLVSKSGNESYYKVTAIGQPGQQAGFYMSVAGQPAQKVCVITFTAEQNSPVLMIYDTISEFSIKKGASYTLKITGATSFNPGSSGVFQTQLVSKSGNDSYYKVSAIGQPGQQAGFYMSVAGQPAQKVCVITVGAAGGTTPIAIQSDTNSDFSLAKGAGYQFKITAPGATAVNFTPGTSGVLAVALVAHTGNDFYYKVTAVGLKGQQAGIYVSVPGQTAKKLCVVTVK